MIHTFHYEPQDQHQEFEPREQQRNDPGQGYLHLSFSLHLNLDTRLRRIRHTPIARVTTIFAAFMGALSLALGPLWTRVQGVETPPALEVLFGLAGYLVVAGALLGVGAVLVGGVPLVVSAWRTGLRNRLLLLVPVLASLLTIACALLAVLMLAQGFPRPPLILPVFLFYGGTLVGTIAIIRAVYRATIADKWLRLANRLSWLVVGGIVLMLIGVVCWGFALVLIVHGWFALFTPWLLLPSGLFLTTMVALWAAFWNVQLPASQPHPHDASSSEGASPGEPRGYRD